MQGKTNLKLLIYFFIPIIMIGYPSIKSVSFNNGLVELQKTTRQVELNPRDTAAISKLVAQMEDLSTARATQSSEALSAVSEAQVALGQYEDAQVTAQKAAAINPTSNTVKQAQKNVAQKIEVKKELKQHVQELQQLNKKLESKPNNRLTIDTITRILQQVNQYDVHADKEDLLTVAWSNSLIGKADLALQAAEMVESSSKVMSNEVDKLKEKINNARIERTNPTKESQRMPAPANNRKRNTPAPKSDSPPPPIAAPAPIQVDTTLFKIRMTVKKDIPMGKWVRKILEQ